MQFLYFPMPVLRPSKGGFDVALSLVCQPTGRLFGTGQMSLSLFRYNTNVAVVLNLCDAVSNIDQPRISLRITVYV